jgi:hypothetical protein
MPILETRLFMIVAFLARIRQLPWNVREFCDGREDGD